MDYTIEELFDLADVSQRELDIWQEDYDGIMNKIYELEDGISVLQSEIDDIGGDRWYAETQIEVHKQNLEDIKSRISDLI